MLSISTSLSISSQNNIGVTESDVIETVWQWQDGTSMLWEDDTEIQTEES